MPGTEKTSIVNQPLLTIAIPTFNRAKYLAHSLERIREEIASLNIERRCLIRIYVSDNASSDNSPDVVAQYAGLFAGSLATVRNSQNTGADHNIAQCYESANSPYIWIMGDDDILLPGGLGKVLDVLISEQPDILYVNSYWFKDEYPEKLKQHISRGIFSTGDTLEFVRRTNVMLTFISGLIVRSGAKAKYRKELMSSNMIQLSWVLPLLLSGSKFTIIKDWVIAAKEGNSGGYGLFKVFGENLQSIAIMALKDKPELARTIKNGTIVNFFPGFVIQSRKGNKEFEAEDMTAGLKQVFGDNWRYHLFLVPVLRMPLILSRYYYFFIVILRRLFGSLLV